MPDNNIDTLKIKVDLDSSSAIEKLNRLISRLNSLGNTKPDSSFSKLEGTLGRIESKVNSLKSASIKAPEVKGFEKIEESIAKASASTTEYIKNIQKFNRHLKGIEKETEKEIKKSTSAFSGLGKNIKEAFNSTILGKFSSMIKAIGRIALYRIFRSMIKQVTQAFKTGIDNMYQYSKEFNGRFAQSMDSLASSALSYKNSIGAAVATVFEQLAPYADKLVDKLMNINNTIAMVLAGLAGKSTYTKAVRTTTEYAAAANQAAKNTGKVKEKVEELKRSFAGLDEITVIGDLPTPDTSSASGYDAGANTPNYSSMFVEAPVNFETIEKVKKSLKSLIPIVSALGVGFGAWNIGKLLSGLGLFKSWRAAVGAAGAAAIFYGITDALTRDRSAETIAQRFGNDFKDVLATTLGGAALGTAIMPGWGTLIGGAAGLIAGSITVTFAGDYWTQTKEAIAKFDNGELSPYIHDGTYNILLELGVDTESAESWARFAESIVSGFENAWLTTKQVWGNIGGWAEENVITPVKEKLSTAFTFLSNFFNNIWAVTVAVWIKAPKWFDDNVVLPLKLRFLIAKAFIIQTFSEAWNKTKQTWNIVSSWFNNTIIQPTIRGFSYLKDKIELSDVWKKTKATWGAAAFWFENTIINPTVNVFRIMKDKIGAFFSGMWNSIKNMGVAAINNIIFHLESAINGIIGGVNWFIDKFNAIGKWAAGVTGRDFYFVNEVQGVSLPRVYANGGVVEDGLFYANHNEIVGRFSNGRTVVANNEMIVEGISEGVADANAEQNTLLREQNRLLRMLLEKDSTIDVSDITRAFNRQNKRNGQVTVPVGV